GGDYLGGPALRTSVGPSLANTAQNTTNVAGTTTAASVINSGPVDATGLASQNVNLPATGLNGFNAGAISAVLFNRNFTRFIRIELTAPEAEGKGKIISRPRVL